MKYSDPFINQNVLIRVSEYNNTQTRLSSANMLRSEIGSEMVETLLDKFFDLGIDRHSFKLRTRMQIDFVSK